LIFIFYWSTQIVDLEPLKELQSELERLYKIDNSSFTIKQVKALTERLKRVKDEGQVCKTMGAIANALNPRRHKKKGYIHTQPRAISRRKEGAPRGARRIAAGRPKSTDPKKRSKRLHNMSKNIEAGIPSARCH